MAIDTSIFKAYDIRGIYPTQINEELAYKIGLAYANIIKPQKPVMVGCDVRNYSKPLKAQVIKGLNDGGVDTVDVGLISTDMIYFGVGTYGSGGGIQVTASHNPAEYHGMKMVKEGVVPMTLDSGVGEIRDLIISGNLKTSEVKGSNSQKDILEDYAKYVLTWVNSSQIKPMKVVYNPNFGFEGKVFEKVVEVGKLPITLIPLNNEPNGNFPKGRPDPFIPENRVEISELVKKEAADLGVAWDADADRVFFVADNALFLDPYYLNTVLIKQMLKKFPGEKIIYDPRYTWGLIETIEQAGGKPVLVRVGHSYIKEAMRRENALFATESSGHTYYRDYWFSDCGILPALQVIEHISTSGKKLSEELLPIMNKYFISAEINTEVADKEGKMKEIAQKYSDAKQSDLDGIAIEYENWRFCVRPSNTEPLLRLTLEAKSKELMEQKRDEVLTIIRS